MDTQGHTKERFKLRLDGLRVEDAPPQCSTSDHDEHCHAQPPTMLDIRRATSYIMLLAFFAYFLANGIGREAPIAALQFISGTSKQSASVLVRELLILTELLVSFPGL